MIRIRSVRGALAGTVLLVVAMSAGCSVDSLMRRDAAPILHCATERITLSEVSNRMRRAAGCGRSETYVQFSTDSWFHTWDLRERAGFDLNCPVDALSLQRLGDEHALQMGVTGCGHRVVYTYVFTSEFSGAWALDSVSDPATPRGNGS